MVDYYDDATIDADYDSMAADGPPYPCYEYGHFDCASTPYGPCEAEKYATLMAADALNDPVWFTDEGIDCE